MKKMEKKMRKIGKNNETRKKKNFEKSTGKKCRKSPKRTGNANPKKGREKIWKIEEKI
jgi:hypothetical protein